MDGMSGMRTDTSIRTGARPRIIVVLGMHRSGTSALAGVLQTAGVWMGDNLYPGDDWNAKGYFEDRALVAMNERMLAALGRRWESLAPPIPTTLASLDGFLDEACALLMQQLGGQPMLAVKDPRLCHLLPFWQRAFARCGLDERYVLAIRSPSAVCRSLSRRDGFGWSRSAWLWTGHTMAAVDSAQDRPSMLIDFDDLLTDAPATARRLAAFCGLPPMPAEREAAVRAFVAAELPTPEAALPAPTALPDLPKHAFALLQTACRRGASAAALGLSPDWMRLRTAWTGMTARLQFADELSVSDASLLRLQQRLTLTEAGLSDAQHLALQRLGEIQALSARIAATDVALGEADRLAIERLQEIEALHRRIAATDNALAEAQRLALERLDALSQLQSPSDGDAAPTP